MVLGQESRDGLSKAAGEVIGTEALLMDGPLRIELLGGLRVIAGDRTITRFRTRKTAELLAYLAYHLGRAHSREILIELFWPECDVDAGRHNLSMALTALRQELIPATSPTHCALMTDRYTVAIDSTQVSTDVSGLVSSVEPSVTASAEERIECLSRAMELYQGELLPGFYNDWIFPEQQRLEDLYIRGLSTLINLLESRTAMDRAVRYALAGISLVPHREEPHREAIRLYVRMGDTAAAKRQLKLLERMMQADPSAEPAAETELLLKDRVIRPAAFAEPVGPSRSAFLEPVGGALPLESPLYVLRETDRVFGEALRRGDSIVLVKGARQVGKTSLLARALQEARNRGDRVVLTHLQVFNESRFETPDSLLAALADSISEQFDLPPPPGEGWNSERGPNASFRRFMRKQAIPAAGGRLIWALDEVDRLFKCSFASDLFGLFRSWHDERALDPAGPWSFLTLAMAYSTEPHLFITDINQSPFNVGTRLELPDFTTPQVTDLNQRHGSPLKEGEDLMRFQGIVGGHPYLVQRGLHEIAAHGTRLEELERKACADDWIFGEHLRRVSGLVCGDAELSQALRTVLAGRSGIAPSAFYRLRSAGILSGESVAEARARCPLYADYLLPLLTPIGARG